MASLLADDYPNLENHYQQLTNLRSPTLILWGRQDKVFYYTYVTLKCDYALFQVYTAEGADYFLQLIPNAEKIVFDDCGHFMAIDKPDETAEHIMDFFNRHCNYEVDTVASMHEFD